MQWLPSKNDVHECILPQEHNQQWERGKAQVDNEY